MKKIDKDWEKLETVAEGSVDQAKQVFKEDELEREEKRNNVLNYLDRRKLFRDYNTIVAEILIARLQYVDWNGWRYNVAPTKEGVVMEIFSPQGKIYRQAFKPVRGPRDIDAIDIFAMRAQNTIDGQTSPHQKDPGIGSDKKGTEKKISS